MFYWLTTGNLINLNAVTDFNVVDEDEIEMFLGGGTSYTLSKKEFDYINLLLVSKGLVVNQFPQITRPKVGTSASEAGQ